jgi:hypothetical protein
MDIDWEAFLFGVWSITPDTVMLDSTLMRWKF